MSETNNNVAGLTAGSVWRHHSGRIYRVLFVANDTSHPRDGYPPMVVYEGENGRRWAGRLDGWTRRMTFIASPPPDRVEASEARTAQAIADAYEDAARVAQYHGNTWSGTRCAETCLQESAVDEKVVEIAAAIRARIRARSTIAQGGGDGG